MLHFRPHPERRRIPSVAAALSLFLVAFLAINGVYAQTRETVKREAESQLQQMTPQQVDTKIKEYGMTRAEAEAKAKELGIDLNAYLQQSSASSSSSSQPVTTQSDASPDAQIEPQNVSSKVAVQTPQKGEGGLRYFGYDIFLTTPSAFEPNAVGPADPEYVIGPGDVLRVAVWGQVEMQNELTVDKEGRIFIPTVGPVLVSGQTLEAGYTRLKAQMAKSYSGLVSHPPTVWMDVTIAKLRPKRIFIMGEVSKPGGYTLSSYATVFSALYSVGGPTVRGSLRDIRVIRGNKTIAHIDLYDYLVGADSTNDIRVQNNDIVFVPPRGKTVAVTKEVLRPAIYELLPRENLDKLLGYAGGARNTAYLERIQVDRIIPFKERSAGGPERRVIDVNFREILNQNRDYDLADGDVVTVYSIFDERTNVVKISGAVMRPGSYQLEKATSVKALIAVAEGLLPSVFTGVAHIIRYNDDWITRRIITFSLQDVLSEAQTDIALHPKDEVLIYSTESIEVKNKFVTIFGQVKVPGKYPLADKMTLDDLVLLAGGYTEEAEMMQAEVSRVTRDLLTGDSLSVILHPPLPKKFDELTSGREGDTISLASIVSHGHFLLQHRDEILIRPDPDYKVQQNITVEGDFLYPGVYAIQRRGERLSELLARAGGPTKTSYLGGAEFFRGGQRLLIDFSKAYFGRNEKHDVQMHDGDVVRIPSRPQTVLVSGEVNKAGLLSFIDGESVSDYIDRAGGLTDSANYAVLTQPTGESRRVDFGFLRQNPPVAEGSSIVVTKVPPPAPVEKGESFATTVKDMFAILSAAATIVFIVYQTTK